MDLTNLSINFRTPLMDAPLEVPTPCESTVLTDGLTASVANPALPDGCSLGTSGLNYQLILMD